MLRVGGWQAAVNAGEWLSFTANKKDMLVQDLKGEKANDENKAPDQPPTTMANKAVANLTSTMANLRST